MVSNVRTFRFPRIGRPHICQAVDVNFLCQVAGFLISSTHTMVFTPSASECDVCFEVGLLLLTNITTLLPGTPTRRSRTALTFRFSTDFPSMATTWSLKDRSHEGEAFFLRIGARRHVQKHALRGENWAERFQKHVKQDLPDLDLAAAFGSTTLAATVRRLCHILHKRPHELRCTPAFSQKSTTSYDRPLTELGGVRDFGMGWDCLRSRQSPGQFKPKES